MKVPLGERRLDDLLGGGVEPTAAILAYGAPFAGKHVLARAFALAGMRAGVPAVFVLTKDAAVDVRDELAEMDPAFPEHEKAGLARFVDAYSAAVGADAPLENVEYVDSPMNLHGITLALNQAQRRVLPLGAHHRLVVDSASTLAAYSGAGTAFRFLQVLLGKARRAGASSMTLLDQGMHADAEVQAFKHLVDGVVEMSMEDVKPRLRIEGLGVNENRGWVEYEFTRRHLAVTGSFGAGRIR